MARDLRPILVMLGLFLGGCSVDVEHALSRLEGDQVAYRLRLVPQEGMDADWGEVAASLPSAPAGSVVRWWRETDGAWVVQARFSDLASYAEHVEQTWARLVEVWPVPTGARPPRILEDGESWRVDADAVAIGDGRWALWLDGPSVRGAPTSRVDGRPVWYADGGITDINARILPDPPPSLADFLARGAPSLACALAGMALLIWVNRRTRRRRLGRAR